MPESSGLSSTEVRFFSYVQTAPSQTVQTGELVEQLGLTPPQERKLLSRLSRRGLIARVRRGLYLVPKRLPPGGKWSPSEALALTTLIEDRRGRYQISGLNAFSRYGWDDQVSNQVFAYNNRISGQRQIGSVSITLVKVGDSRLGGTRRFKTPDGIDLIYSSPARALLDAVYDWSRFDTLPRAYAWARADLNRNEGLAAELVSLCLRFANQGTMRRIGKLLEMEGCPEPLLRKLQKALRDSSSFIPWIPTKPKRGQTDRRWGIVLNDG